MLHDNIASAEGTSSFLMECLIWNIPDRFFTNSTWSQTLREAMIFLLNSTMDYEKCSNWVEVSELKYLFHNSQAWTWESTNKFLSDCWDYAGFK